MKRIFALISVILMTLGFSASAQKVVVAYFSATGTTEAVAQKLAAEKNADLYRIMPKVAYTTADLDWRDTSSRSSLEMKDPDSRPELMENKSLADYDVIYLGYPIWWGIAPRIIDTFIEQANIEGKKVYPFATSGGSSMDKSANELKASYPQIKWQKCKLMNEGQN